ncbi:MAG: GNAT family N-acetyltransferase [Tannerellaceae bacterium]|nr:GNAT family N-acetyltransferase [Tannerellaceae bacterium]
MKPHLTSNPMPQIISVREHPEYQDMTIHYFQSKWKSVLPVIYDHCIRSCMDSPNPLPQWYLLKKGEEIIGSAGLVANDFISRMDLYPWICGLFIEEPYRGKAYGALLMEQAKADAKKGGFTHVYLSTDHIGYYEKYGFQYIGTGYHPWDESSRIYGISL